MATFKRIVESEIPNSVEKAFGLKPEPIVNDQYDYLEKTANARRETIMRQLEGTQKEERQKKVFSNWQESNQPVQYSDNYTRVNESNIDEISPYHLSTNTIRRSYSAEDTSTSDAIRDIKFNENQDFATAYLMMQDVYYKDAEQIKQITAEAMAEKIEEDELQAKRERDIENNKNRRQQWEQNTMSTLRNRTMSSSRANPLIRTSYEQTTGSSFGYSNNDRFYQSIKNREQEQAEMLANKMIKEKSIKAFGKTPDEKYNDWLRNLNVEAVTYQTYKPSSDWLDRLIEE